VEESTEIFLDFGLFEFLVVIGIAALSRRVYSSKLAGTLFLIVSLIGPAALMFLVAGGVRKGIAGLCLATTMVNVAVLAAVLQRGRVPELKFPLNRRKQFGFLRGAKNLATMPSCNETLGQAARADILINDPDKHPSSQRRSG
jgi:hypothetical protein